MPQAPMSMTPNVSDLQIPVDAWTQPFWEAAAEEQLVMPKCTGCDTFRWPPGPFCPECSSQEVAWAEAGCGVVYSYTVAPRPAPGGDVNFAVPALIEFPQAGGMRLIASIVATPIDAIRVGAPVRTRFSQAANGKVPVFTVITEVDA